MTASRILVVDDEADIRGLLKEILSEEGYEVDVAADAAQARSARRRFRIWSCSTFGCPTPTGSRCSANGR
jgi:DNA-binding NtrC family response regulator